MPALVELLLPEIILCAGALVILFLGLSPQLGRNTALMAGMFLVGAIAATWRIASGAADWEGHINALIGLLVILTARHLPVAEERGEFFALILFSFAGVSLTAVANDLVMLFLALELVSVPTYILIGLSRRDIRAQEAAGKYFFLGAFSAAMTLYGFSFIYGAAGTMTIYGATPGSVPNLGEPASIALWFSQNPAEHMTDPLLLLGVLIAFGGIAYKLAAVPLHFYIADVYQGAAAPVTGMLGFVPKMAGFVAVIHLLTVLQWQIPDAVFWALWVVAAATMTVGNALAFMQYNVKRLLAYSSVAHSGYMLMALLVGPGLLSATGNASLLRNGVGAVLFYAALYGCMNLGAFAALSLFRKSADDDEDQSAEMIDDLAGAARRRPWTALGLAICVLGLMGFPLTGGFIGKLYLFSAVLSAAGEMPSRSTALIALVVIGVLNAAVGAAYYLRIIASCYWREPSDRITPATYPALRVSLACCAIITLLGFAVPGALVRHSAGAAVVDTRIPPNRPAVTSADGPHPANSEGRRLSALSNPVP